MLNLLFLCIQVKSVIIYVNETITYPLTDFFGYLENPTYQIMVDQDSYLSIIPQINLRLDPQTHSRIAERIISAKAQILNDYWTNQFYFLEYTNGIYTLVYSDNPQGKNEATPKFIDHLIIIDQENYTCYDAEQYNGTHFIADCALQTQGQPFENKLFVISKDKVIETQTVPNLLQYQSIEKRKLSFFIYDENKIGLLQGFMQSANESIIQIYAMEYTKISFTLRANISKNVLKTLLNLNDSYTFSLLDFKVIENQIGVLDKQVFCILSSPYFEQLDIEYYQEFSDNVIAFDFAYYLDDNGMRNRIHVILKNASFDLYNKTKKMTYFLETPVSQQAQIKISQKFIIIEDNNIVFQYRMGLDMLLMKKKINGENNFLINPQYPDIIQISNNLTNRYFLSEGYLQIQSKTFALDPTNYTIKASSLQKQLDHLIELQILKENDGMMYVNGRPRNIVEDSIYSNQQQQEVVPFVSCPNIEIGVDPLDNQHDIEFVVKQAMKIEQWPTPDTIHFQDMIQSDQNLVYVFFQLTNLKIQLWECFQTTEGLTKNCIQISRVQKYENIIPILVNQMKFQWWINTEDADQKTYYFAYLTTNDFIQIHQIDFDYQWSQQSFSMPLTQILRLKNNLYILSDQGKTIKVMNNELKLIDSIDEKQLIILGITDSWSPKKLFGNYKQLNNLLLIQNNDNLILITHQTKLHIVKNIPIAGEIEVSLYQDTFYIIKVNSGKSILEQYSIKDLNNIYFIRSVQLFNYEFYQPLTITQSRDNGYLFILTNSQKVLLFRPDEENSNDQLFRIFNVSYLDKVTMSACGDKKIHFYFSNGSDITYLAILKQSQMVMRSLASVQQEDYFSNFTQFLFFKNKQHTYDFGVKIYVLNILQNFTIHKQDKISVPKDQEFFRVPLTNLYSGQVLSLQCDGCDDRIQLITPLQILSSNKSNYSFYEIQYYSEDLNVALSEDLHFLDHDENTTKIITLGDYYYDCFAIQVQKDSAYIIVLCFDYQGDYPSYKLLLITCDLILTCQISDLSLDDVQEAAKKMILLKDNLVLILDIGKILVYYIDSQTITLTQIIETKNAIINFIVQEYDEAGKHYYIFSMIDVQKNLNVIFTQFSENRLNIISSSMISIQNLIIESGYFASKSMNYVQLFTTKSAKKGELNYIVVSDHEVSVALQIILNEFKGIEMANVKQVFIPYSDWIIQEGLAAQFGEWLMVPYQNQSNYLLALYHMNDSQLIQNIIFGLLIPRVCFPGIDQTWIFWYGPLIYSQNETSFKLFTCGHENTFTRYEILNYPEMHINQTSDLEQTQTVILTASNIFNKQSINLTIEKPGPSPDPTPDPDDSSSNHKLWLIIIIVVGSLFIIGIGILLYMKYKQIGWFKVHVNGYQEHVDI